jgi:hypothetical protein
MSEKEKGKVEPLVKKIAIVGCSDSKDLAPFNDKEWEIWGVNNLFHHITRYDRWFEIHNLTRNATGDWMRRGQTNFRGQDINAYVADIIKMKCPIYMQRHWDEIPTSLPFPLEEAKRRFGSVMGWYGGNDPEGVTEDQLNRRLYGTNTVTYMILLAIMEGATHIGVWGVDMAVDSEYHFQRPSCEFALGIAIGLGIKVYIPSEADLLKTVHLYGFEEMLNDDWLAKLKKMNDSMGKREVKASNELKAAEETMHRSEGAKRSIAMFKELLKDKTQTPETMLAKIEEAEKGVIIQDNEARQKHANNYSAQQQYIGARQAEREISKIWGTLQ